MYSIREKIVAFISSFLPLYLLLILKEWPILVTVYKNKKGLFSKENIGISVMVIIVLFFILLSIISIGKIFLKKGNREAKVDAEYNLIGDGVINYLFAYIVPLVSIDIKDNFSLLSNLLLFIIIGILYIRYDLEYLNPILVLFGYRVYVDVDTGKDFIISKLSADQLSQIRDGTIPATQYKISPNVKVVKKVSQ